MKEQLANLLDADVGLRAALSERYDFSELIGNSGAMRQVYEQIAQVAPAQTTVIIQGASGCGKEVVARAIHNNSPRKQASFIKVSCSALSEALIEAELFGVERGAYTDATQTKPGRFEMANGSTLLLDEIAEMPLLAQVKLLRVLETGEYERLGGTETRKTDVRIIATTNRSLEREVLQRRFREDLYYRLSVFPITMPRLLDRREDIVPLAEHFLNVFASREQKNIRRFTSHSLELLTHYEWPGNVRELENAIERAVIICDQEIIQHYHLPATLQTAIPEKSVLQAGLFAAVEAYERELLCDVLKITNGQRIAATQMLKISDRVLSYKIKKYEINLDEYRK